MFSKGEGKDLGHMAVNTQRLVGKEWDAQEGEYKREQETENILNALYTFIKLSKSIVNYLQKERLPDNECEGKGQHKSCAKYLK